MLVCDMVGIVCYVFVNVLLIIGCREVLVGWLLFDIIGNEVVYDLCNEVIKIGGLYVVGVLLNCQLFGVDYWFDILIYYYKDCMFVEFELSLVDDIVLFSVIDLIQLLICCISLEFDVVVIVMIGVKLVWIMFGYDWVMVYEFFYNGVGCVIVELKCSDLISFMGQYFLVGDILFQVCWLYLLNLIWVIVDVCYVLLLVLLLVSVSDELIDMLFVVLCSVLLIYCEYLQNMGVVGLMLMLIVVNGELWGLIVCYYDILKMVGMLMWIGVELFV